MKITLEPSGEIDVVNGAQARLWTGEDEYGTPLKAWIVTVSPQTHDAEANERFAKALKEQRASLRYSVFDARLIL
jgi:hypothetical protein